MIHRNDRAANTKDAEHATFALFDREWKPRLLPIFREIGARLGLDYFGVDCNIDETGRVLLFEANACMNILANTSPSPNIWDEPVARIKEALERHLASPEKWRQTPSRAERYFAYLPCRPPVACEALVAFVEIRAPRARIGLVPEHRIAGRRRIQEAPIVHEHLGEAGPLVSVQRVVERPRRARRAFPCMSSKFIFAWIGRTNTSGS